MNNEDNLLKKIYKYLVDIGIFRFISDEKVIRKNYKKIFHKKINLENPKTYNEKLQWLKLYDRKAIYTTMVDKVEAKKYVANLIGDEYIIPTLGVWNKFKDIDFSKLPNQFVLKCSNGSGGLLICKDKNKLNIIKQRLRFNLMMKRNYYYRSREWPYKNVKQRIIAEQYMEDKKLGELRDYKFFCFDGKPEFLYVSDGLSNHATASISFYDMNFNLMTLKRKDFPLISKKVEKPKNFGLMKELAAKLSKGFKHLRVDFYEINGKVYFGELTFYTCGGYVPFEDPEWDYKLGDLINIK